MKAHHKTYIIEEIKKGNTEIYTSGDKEKMELLLPELLGEGLNVVKIDCDDNLKFNMLKNAGSTIENLIEKFEDGLNTKVTPTTETISLGQKQLISFIRAIIRQPDLLIMDEATANIDTVTEELLQNIIDKLPSETTKVIIAHRLNTIKNADEIYFVNNGSVQTAESFEKSIELITKSKRNS